MPALNASYVLPQRGSNDDFNDTFKVTTTGTGSALTCADAWGTYTGTFTTPLTQQESIFTRNYAQPSTRVYWIPGPNESDAYSALSRFVNSRYAYTGGQVISLGNTAGLTVNPVGQPTNAWQSYGNHSNGATTWSVGPNKVRSGSNLGLGVTTIAGTPLRFKFAPMTTTNTDIADAWNAFILSVNGGVYPTSNIDPLFITDIYWWAMHTADLQPCNAVPSGNGTAYVGPYIDAIKRQYGPAYGL